MRFAIRHLTCYRYSRPVQLGPQTLRLRPRCDGAVQLEHHSLILDPAPAGRSEWLDNEGNVVTQVWFAAPSDHLRIESTLTALTTRHNPYDYLPAVDGGALYGPGLCARLAPYLAPLEGAPAVRALASRLGGAGDDPRAFLDTLNRHLFEQLEREIRELGPPQSPGQTLKSGIGACRDLAVLFIEVCRLQGIAARFVSGYQRGDTTRERRYMHAWPEVYLRGGGWRGYDPTHGLAVADAHLPVAAAADPAAAAPLEGSFAGDARAQLETDLEIRVDA